MNRRAQTRGGRGYVPGVYQRCHRDCPADRCRNPRHTWYYTVEVAAAGGKRRQFSKGGFETATEAVKARAEVVRQHREGTLPADPRRTLDSWLREWLDGKVRRGEIEGSTERGYRDNIDHYLIPKLGRCKLGELRGLHITRAYGEIVAERQAEIEAAEAKNAKYEAEAETLNAKRGAAGKVRPVAAKRCAVPRPISPASVARIHAVLSGALKSAVKAGMVSRNVAADAELPKAERRKVRPPTPEAYGEFLDAIVGDRLYPLVVLAGNSGLRRGELAGLRWSDIDLSAKARLVVARQRVSVGYQVSERTAKTEAGQDRVVYLDVGTVDALRAWRKQQMTERLAWGPAYAIGEYVFTREDGQPYHPDYLTKSFSRLARRVGFGATKLHTLRHYRAGALISTGADIAAVSKSMGHSSIMVTSDIYGSLFEKAGHEMSEAAAALVPRRRHTA